MELNLKQLQSIGAFVAAEPAQTEITWKQLDGDGAMQQFTAKVFIRRNSCATFEKDVQAKRDGKDAIASKIATTVCDKAGNPILTHEQAQTLNEGLTQALILAIAEVNGGGAKNSQPPMKSGTSSASPSVA